MATYLLGMALVFGMLLAGVLVDRAYRRFAARHPQLGPFREGDGGKCGSCVAGSGCAAPHGEAERPGGSCGTALPPPGPLAGRGGDGGASAPAGSMS